MEGKGQQGLFPHRIPPRAPAPEPSLCGAGKTPEAAYKLGHGLKAIFSSILTSPCGDPPCYGLSRELFENIRP